MVRFLRRRRLGRTSVRGMIERMDTDAQEVRSWVERERMSVLEDDILVRWGCTTSIDNGVTLHNRTTLNTARAIHQVNDKAGFRMYLMEHAPDLIPHTFREIGDAVYPCIIRPTTHSRGRNVYVAHRRDEFVAMVNHTSSLLTGWYASELIDKVAEYRVFVVQGRAVAVAQKTPGNPDDVAWNVAQGGRFDSVRWDDWPLQAVRKSIEAFNHSELDFGGVDVMVDGDGRAYIIEINSAPSLTSDYRQTCMAKAFDWIAEHGKERIPLIEERGGYRKFIHPAVCDRAILVPPIIDDDYAEELGDEFEAELSPIQQADIQFRHHLTEYSTQDLIDELKRRVEV